MTKTMTDDMRRQQVRMWLSHSIYATFRRDLFEAPLEVQESAMRREFRFMGLAVAVLVSTFAISSAIHWNDPPPPPPPAPERVDAGTVVTIELHATTFATQSTVTTTNGIYQVSGSVSAAKGDKVQLEIKPPYRLDSETRRLCVIDSSIKNACYSLE